MQALRERYGDDRQKMSQAMMKLYKDEKVNPLGGCLPMLLQLPIFLALYWVLLESVELRHAPLFLWIDDLSARDPYFVLPILMGASMFIMQKLQPTPATDPMNRKCCNICRLSLPCSSYGSRPASYCTGSAATSSPSVKCNGFTVVLRSKA